MTIVRQKSLYPGTKMKRIIALGDPLPSHETNRIIFTVASEAWELLKRDEEFWTDVLKAIAVPSFRELDESDETYVFGEESVIGTLDAAWYEALLTRFPEIKDLEPGPKKRRVREAFLSYMHWYDKEAVADFLIVYANAIKDDQLVPLAETLEHGVAKPGLVDTALELVGPLSDPSLAELNILSVLDYHTRTSHFKYYFYMKRPTDDIPAPPFVIKLDDQYEKVTTHGPITRVLKFLYQGTVILIVTGPSDSKLIRFRYDFKPRLLIIVDEFRPLQTETGQPIFPSSGDEVDVWEDLVYVDESQPTRYATHKKSVPSKEKFFVLDLQALAAIAPPLSSYTEEERKAYRRRQAVERLPSAGGRLLTEEERAALVQVREAAGMSGILPNGMTFADVSAPEYEEMRRILFVMEPQDPERYSKIAYKLSLPSSPIFVEQRTDAHRFQSKETLGWRVIRVPGEEREDRFHFAVLDRQYIDQMGAYTVELYVFTYVKNASTGRYVNEAHTLVFVDLEHMMVAHDRYPMMDRDVGPTTIKNFNVIFDTPNDCRVEVTQLALITGETKTMSSRRFKFRSFGGGGGAVVRDAAFFDLMARHHYRIHDYRHDRISNRLFECIFTKYNYANQEIRILVYKQSVEENGTPAIADVRVAGLPLPGVNTVSPQHTMDNLCFLTFDAFPNQFFKLKFKEDRELVSLPANYDLSASVACMAVEESTHCVFCGSTRVGGSRRDSVSGKFYCGKVCQYVFCKTRAM